MNVGIGRAESCTGLNGDTHSTEPDMTIVGCCNSTSDPDDGSNGNEGTMSKGEGCRLLGDVMTKGEGCREGEGGAYTTLAEAVEGGGLKGFCVKELGPCADASCFGTCC
jgi:hypothetical protein